MTTREHTGVDRARTLATAPADVVVIGSGAAGMAAAVTAAHAGCSVVVYEKAGFFGGTTAKSGGVYWVADNHLQRQRGMQDDRQAALRYMVRVSAGDSYDPDSELGGLEQWEFDLLRRYVDLSPGALEFLEQIGAVRSTIELGLVFPDYRMDLPEHGGHFGRALCAVDAAGGPGRGDTLIAQLSVAARRLGVVMLSCHRLEGLVVEDDRVAGVRVRDERRDVSLVTRADAGVILALGGFSHSATLRREFLPTTVWGSCATASNTGDVVPLLTDLGIPLVNMDCAWWDQVAVEHVVHGCTETELGMWIAPGDSSLMVDLNGHRVVNEKAVYNERARVHLQGVDAPVVLAYIFDQRTWDLFAASKFGYPIPGVGESRQHVISGESIPELCSAIGERLTSLAELTGGLGLADGFTETVTETIARFNAAALVGEDPQFVRGEQPIERFFHGPAAEGSGPNPTMAPMSPVGPYHCILVGLATLDTKGGPRTSVDGEVLDATREPIRGLYAVGNVAASPSRQGYWAAGATIGPALVMGHAAADHAARRRPSASAPHSTTPHSIRIGGGDAHPRPKGEEL